MLELRNIVKDYKTGGETVKALRGVSIAFRQSEFVAVLGPSGCGKTTLLNIIGGLDQYTTGDLLIHGVSTKRYNDRDWDAYRNHSVGFVFQTYNLIPHQSVLSNVEIALTISGVSKAERRRRAREALEQVGLGDQLRKKPNQMSGGQMQRVAIARALVNNPDILLADEPTGALDSETSVQVMEILKEISREKLVVMVTHNPDLAEQYASRIVRIKDGTLLSDSNPYPPAEQAPEAAGKRSRVSMSFATAFSLSLHNLMTKKARTFLTAFAGSIGIIGIALILSLSNGINRYITKVQEDTLSSYPISIEAESMDTTALITSMMDARSGAKEEAHPKDAVYSNTIIYDMLNALNETSTTTNNLEKFKAFLDTDPEVEQAASAIQYVYDLNMPIFTTDVTGKIVKTDFMELMMEAMDQEEYQSSAMMQKFSPLAYMEVWSEMLPGEDGRLVSDLLYDQYDLLYGAWPERYDQVVLIVNENNELSDLVLYALGFQDTQRLTEIVKGAINGETVDAKEQSWSYAEICEKKYKVILPVECWQHSADEERYLDMSQTETGLDYLYNADSVGTTLEVVGIIRPNGEAAATMLSSAIGYTSALTDHLIAQVSQSPILQEQLAKPDTDIFTGLPFPAEGTIEPTDGEKASAIQEYMSTLDTAKKAELYTYIMSIPLDSELEAMVEQALSGVTREELERQVVEQYAQSMGVDPATVADYIASMDDATLFENVKEALRASITEQFAAQAAQQLGVRSAEELAAALDAGGLEQEQYVKLFDTYMPPTISDSTYEDNLETLGFVDQDSPSAIHLYAATFSDKDKIADIITAYNEKADEADQITYTDYVALLMHSITDIISGISYLLIAFVAISLVVSSIMIGIITYISVLERTREIGILRALGASKRDVSNVFNAETLIVGFGAGALGIGVTWLLCLPINAILHHLTQMETLNAQLPWAAALILVAISMLLTWIAGLIPARMAARKDPVEALRTE